MTNKFDAVIFELNEELTSKTSKLNDVNAKIPTATTEQRKELLDKSVKLRAEIDSLTNALHLARVQQRLAVERLKEEEQANESTRSSHAPGGSDA